MKTAILLVGGLALLTIFGTGCAMTKGAEIDAEAASPCAARMSWGTGVRRYYGDCDPSVRILGW